MGFPGGSDSKEPVCNVGDLGWAWQPTPVLLPGESPWTDDPGWRATVHGVTKSQTRLNE